MGDTATTCGDESDSSAQSKAILRYVDAGTDEPTSTEWVHTIGCEDIAASSLIPIVKKDFPKPKIVKSLNMTILVNSTGSLVFDVSNSSLYLNLNKPTLQLINDGFNVFPDKYNVYQVDGEWGSSVAFEIIDKSAIPHPIHLHGHDFSILAQGSGTWNGTMNLSNPARRDTATVPASGYLVIGFLLDNPGTWTIHCHLPMHVASGLGWQFVELISLIEKNGLTYQTCSRWNDWTDLHMSLQTDSGI